VYPNLKLHIFLLGIHQNYLAKQVGIDETALSKIIHGYRQPSEQQRMLLARYLDVDENWLFEKYDGSSAVRMGTDVVSPEREKNGRA
jgi:transcriptional regulator with XRE-family HTH domain